ncbi:RNA polymerase II transcriptional coactivator KIWI-like protein [Carex littledalei]|uniref:RNA polymerase II transcriptional coactivator KIWI-like protein n=1 Tax=Carex littledalei TaxID=544730 RepID=A0A833VYQ0_9POAL|nr:RNA polymerase II transcriptional coactivator KIWI-like protein [Carex littledalei]
MWKWKKGNKRNWEGDASGSAGAPPPKRQAGDASSDDPADGIVVCEVSKNKRITVRNWNGNVMVDFREYFVKDGKQLPTKKGISLSMDQWKILRDHIEEIDDVVQEYGA